MPTYPPATQTPSPEHPVCSSIIPARPVPTHGPGGTFSVLAVAHIAAPPAVVLKAIRNTTEWEKWNSFCPRCVIRDVKRAGNGSAERGGDEALESGKEGWLEEGVEAVIEVFMNGDGLDPQKKKSRDQPVIVTKLEPLSLDGNEQARKGYRIAWKSTGFSHWQLHSERVMEFEEVEEVGGEGGTGTKYECWETFGGLLGSVVKATVGSQLVDRFGDYARDVKGFVEGGMRAGEGGSIK